MKKKIIIQTEGLSNIDAIKLLTGDSIMLNSYLEADSSMDITIKCYAIYTDSDKETGETFNAIAILADDGYVYGTKSDTFIDTFTNILELASDMDLKVEGTKLRCSKKTSKKKSGQSFLICSLV